MTDGQTEWMESAHEQERAADRAREERKAEAILAKQKLHELHKGISTQREEREADEAFLVASAEDVGNALDRQIGGDHYKGFKIQPIEFCHANNIGFVEGTIIKYVLRFRTKGGREDLANARHCLDMLEQMEYGK